MKMSTNITQPEAMIFDLDGTLFQTETLLLPAYHAAFEQMREEGIYPGETPPDERILGALGMLLEHIWDRVIPSATQEVRKRADELLLHYQMEGLEEGIGELYPEVPTTLKLLKEKGVKLFVASNGLERYVKEVIRHKGLSHLFVDLYSAGEYNTTSKVDLVRMLLERYSLRSAWMFGDRSSDVEAGLGNGLTVIGCNYAGFGKAGELDGSHHIITEFKELTRLL
jgi:phosphoglycolate phosphatase